MLTRTARIGGLRLVATPVPAGSELVRVHVGDDPNYDRMIVVTPEDEARVLHLMGWIGDPLSIPWIGARDALFPSAETVRFERLRGGAFVRRVLRLG
uniref:hypothetical protein n=1 Tax=uncultured Sphingomonas sp. TaxID=158754 RepID=UPI0035CB4AE6